MSSTTLPRVRRLPIGALLLTAILVIAAALIFTAIYFVLPENGHFNGLLVIGILSLVFALLAYLSQAVSTDALVQRSLAWGFLGLGFTTLFLTIGLATNPEWSPMARLVALIVLLVLLAIAVAGILWRTRSVAMEEKRVEARQTWARTPPLSAFQYSSAAPAAPVDTTSPPTVPPGAR